MTLSDAVAQFESRFASVSSGVTQQYDPSLPVTWSGGRRDFPQPAWALYSTKDDAILAWLDTAVTFFHGGSLKWVVRPELLEFMITIADKNGAHRAVNNRFAVKSQFVTEE